MTTKTDEQVAEEMYNTQEIDDYIIERGCVLCLLKNKWMPLSICIKRGDDDARTGVDRRASD